MITGRGRLRHKGVSCRKGSIPSAPAITEAGLRSTCFAACLLILVYQGSLSVCLQSLQGVSFHHRPARSVRFHCILRLCLPIHRHAKEMLIELKTFVENLTCDCQFIMHHTVSGKNLTGSDFLKRKDSIIAALEYEIEHSDMDAMAVIRNRKRTL